MNVNEKRFNKLGKSTSLGDVLNQIKNSTMDDMAVATLALVKEIEQAYSETDGFGIASVAPIPSRGDNLATLPGYFFSSEAPEEGAIILLVFTDSDFRDALGNLGNKIPITRSKKRHGLNFGVIVKLN